VGVQRQEPNRLLDSRICDLSASSLAVLGMDGKYCADWGTMICGVCEVVFPEGCALECRKCGKDCPY